ncbi:YxeA family protein [Bacillus sp. NPDC060175]|uniref:YxeA family protein n=1 Tax=Bacillus sp. NPDC060175 TaxID=3347061 RepID=UPI00365A534E
MKKLLLGLIGIFILVIGVASFSHNGVTDRYNPLVKEDFVYVKAKESGRLSTVGEVAGDYKLTGYYASGEGRDVKFYAPRGLREGAAERDLYKEPSKVDKNKETIFNAKLKELKGRVLFAANPTRAVEFLEQMVQAADHPTLARSIQDEFFTLGQAVLQSAGGNVEASHKVRQELGNTHNKLVRATQVEGAGEAFEVLQTIESIENGAFVNTAKFEVAFGEFSKDLVEYANDTETYKNVHRDRILQVQMEHADMKGALIQ